MAHISIVSPVYKAENIVDELVKRIIESVSKITADFEIILVEDGSLDNSWQKIEENCKKDKRVKGIQLSRNFGQHYAITAGLDNCIGEWVVVMDCDLQDVPEEIVRLLDKALEGYQIVFAQRIERTDNFMKRLGSALFYKAFAYLTETDQNRSIANFGIYHKDAIQAVLSMGDSFRYFPTMIKWVGFKRTTIEVSHAPRNQGKSSYSLKMLFRLAFDNIISFSDKPLRIIVRIGFLISTLSAIAGIYIIVRFFMSQIEVTGYTSLIVSLWFLSGIIIVILGVIGIYIGRMFTTVKERPTFIIDSTINIEKK